MDTIITDIQIAPLEKSRFVKPFSIIYVQDGVKKRWDCVEAHDSVSCILYHTQFESFLFVKQFRPSLWFYQNSHGIDVAEPGVSYEFCAGIMDKGVSLEQTIKEEILEETGYETNEVIKVAGGYSALGFGANRQNVFYSFIDESMKKTSGGGIEEEKIELFFVPKNKIEDFLFDENKPKGLPLIFGVLWFLRNILSIK